MNPVVKNILVGILAICAGMVTMMAGHYLSNLILPPPAGMDMSDPISFKAHASQLTAGHYALALLSHGLAAFVSGWVVAKFAANQHKRMVHVMGIAWTIMGILNLNMIPHPTWFAIADVCMYIPLAILGGKLARNPL
jgi:uncharacterized membrane protein HdeD (DUF308 family)